MSKCPLCQIAVQDGETYSGLDTPAGYVEGHTACVAKALAPDVLRDAIARGVLPPLTAEGQVAGEAVTTPDGRPRRLADQIAAGLRKPAR